MLFCPATEQGWEVAGAKAGLSWTHFELMGETLSPDKHEHSPGVSMETSSVWWDQLLNAVSSKGGLGDRILDKTWPGRNSKFFHGKGQLKYFCLPTICRHDTYAIVLPLVTFLNNPLLMLLLCHKYTDYGKMGQSPTGLERTDEKRQNKNFKTWSFLSSVFFLTSLWFIYWSISYMLVDVCLISSWLYMGIYTHTTAS